MAKKKYDYFILATDLNDTEQFENYQKALHEYSKADNATLYGFDEEGQASVIFSKRY